MTTPEDLLALADRVVASNMTCNALDVEIELALFQPTSQHKAVRANNAGTKVIYTYTNGEEITCWADDWTMPRRREETLAVLRHRAHLQANPDTGQN